MDLARFRQGMTKHWVAFCLGDAGLLQGLLLASTQFFANFYHSQGSPEEAKTYEQRALHHRGQLLRSMSDSMPKNKSEITDYTIARAVFLAFNEVCISRRPLSIK